MLIFLFSIFVQFFWGSPLKHPSRLCDIHQELLFCSAGCACVSTFSPFSLTNCVALVPRLLSSLLTLSHTHIRVVPVAQGLSRCAHFFHTLFLDHVTTFTPHNVQGVA
jgi:hypothetical protein